MPPRPNISSSSSSSSSSFTTCGIGSDGATSTPLGPKLKHDTRNEASTSSSARKSRPKHALNSSPFREIP